MFVGYSEISVGGTVKHVQHIGIARAFCPPNLPPLLSKVSFPPHQLVIFMESPNTSFICTCSLCCCIIFLKKFRLYVHMLYQFWLTEVYWMLSSALNGQNFPNQNFHYTYLSLLFTNTLPLLMLVFLFFLHPFVFQIL